MKDFEIVQVSKDPRVFEIKNFLSDFECDAIITKAIPNMCPSRVVEEDPLNGVIHAQRTSTGTFLLMSDTIVTKIEDRIENLIKIPRQNGEHFNVLHYDVGQEYKPHYDYFLHEEETQRLQLKNGGQRVCTVIVYLNNVEDGGVTVFPNVNLQIIPQKGNAILFYNIKEDGQIDHNSLHSGAPVLKGSKWIVTKWFRENHYTF